jgi:hypothetical protein
MGAGREGGCQGGGAGKPGTPPAAAGKLKGWCFPRQRRQHQAGDDLPPRAHGPPRGGPLPQVPGPQPHGHPRAWPELPQEPLHPPRRGRCGARPAVAARGAGSGASQNVSHCPIPAPGLHAAPLHTINMTPLQTANHPLHRPPHTQPTPPPAAAAAEEGSRESVDAGCRRLTAAWTRERAARDASVELCDYYERHEAAGQDALLPPGGGGRGGRWDGMKSGARVRAGAGARAGARARAGTRARA